MKKHTIAFAVAGIMLGLAGPASAYVRTRTTAGVATSWKSPWVTMEFSLGEFPNYLDAAGYLNAAQQGGTAWTQASLDGSNRCSNVQLGVEYSAEVEGPVGKDNHNRIVFRQTEWCREPAPTNGEARCYDQSALAITTVFQLKNSGEILDTDIEVNGVNFKWVDYVSQPDALDSQSHDFQGAITHEMGHVLGLEHTCYIPGYLKDGTPIPRPVDNLGNPIPNCGADNPPSITEATMYVSVSSPATEVGLRSLSPDDVQGVCEIYPISPSKGGGCSLAAGRGPGSVFVVLALAGLALQLRRRRRR
jgi:hypothetical protein